MESAVGIAGHPPLVYGNLDVLRGPVIAFYVFKEGDALPVAHAVLISGGAYQHFGKLGAGDAAAQVQVSGRVAHQNAQCPNGLDLAAVIGGSGPGGDGKQRCCHAYRHQKG
ncbi:hypothetical protein SDC9_112228 [bioreactor metagenome]|uniref:Uncharacterized protein n=1 Tax=bioreactor metagenome TaxID=1076179 RepID=A0A645BQ36_9ZZZZ